MKYILSKLMWTDKDPLVKLRLLHTLMAGNPARPDGFSENTTLWTDELVGCLVQGLASKQLCGQLQEVLDLGKVYFVSQCESRKHWSVCSNDLMLYFNSKTSFVHSPEDDHTFYPDSFEIRRFEDLEKIVTVHCSVVGWCSIRESALLNVHTMHAEEILFSIDVVGRLVSATPVSYFQKQERSIKRQVVVIDIERYFALPFLVSLACFVLPNSSFSLPSVSSVAGKASLSITLWSDFAERVNFPKLIELNGTTPVIVAFTSLSLANWRGTFTLTWTLFSAMCLEVN
ncbi:unnamed protein product [Linum trigynum]|uniref:Uncharacterized protein n=1 Tax=Linum trigynum TaxID=586398 RepID=A0AAV2CV98_9ROSI